MDRWCQNKKCPQKKTQSQIRGSKGSKYYQSNKAKHYYYHMFCGQRCMDQWFNVHWQTCLNTVGEIPKQVLPVEDAWYVEYDYGRHIYYDTENREDRYANQGWFLRNNNRGVRQMITQEQAQSPEQIANGGNWQTIDDEQAKELAISLGLAS
tara:strand:+ start:134 stop:589 length:456 start_codon:yes stop_codon:yes gene_type:complete